MKEEEFVYIYNYYWIIILLLGIEIILLVTKNIFQWFPLKKFNILFSILIIIFTAIYIGVRGKNVGVDTDAYMYLFSKMQDSNSFIEATNDKGFDYVMYFFSRFSTVGGFFTFCAFLYLMAAFIGMYRFFSSYAILSLLLFLISPNFFLYGINAIRGGVAASLFLGSLYWINISHRKMYLGILISILVHQSMILPAFALWISQYLKFRNLLFLWSIALIMYLLGYTITTFLGNILGNYEHIGGYLNNISEDTFLIFLNFCIYGASPILAGIYYIYIKKFKDPIYERLLNAYTICNILYIYVMDIQFAERFAYLSGFLMPIVLIYPLLVKRMWSLQYLKLTVILLCVFLFKSAKILWI